MSFIRGAEARLDVILHHERVALDRAAAATEAAAKADKTRIIAEAKAGIAQLKAAETADAPEIKAAVAKALQDALQVVENIAASHGL